jgi:hypothetical protein
MQFVGGSISKGSELQIEVAEFVWKDVEVTIKTYDFVFTPPIICQTKFICLNCSWMEVLLF